MNTLHPKIQFTIEEESDGEVPFLDTLLKRKPDGTISVLSIENQHSLISI